MQIIRILIISTAMAIGACASDRQGRDTSPAAYAAIGGTDSFGVTQETRPDGITEIFVRLNETSSPRRARNMAYYHAARLARAREADTFSVAFDEPGMECEVTPRSEGNFSAAGDPIALVAVAVFAAFYSLAPRRESYEAFPTHTLGVALADGDTVAGDRAPVSVSEKLAALEPEFGSGASKDGERGAWEQNAEANEKVCAERLERQKHMQEAADGQSVEKDGEPSEEDRPGVEQTRADRTRTVSGSP